MCELMSFTSKFPKEVQSFLYQRVNKEGVWKMTCKEVDSVLFKSDSTSDLVYFYFDEFGYLFAFFAEGGDESEDLYIDYGFHKLLA